MRCLVLAEALHAQGHNIHFICRDLPGNQIAHLQKNTFRVHILTYQNFSQTTLTHLSQHQQWLGEQLDVEIKQVLTLLTKEKNADLLVIDHYGLDQQFESAMRPLVKKIIVIDDLADRNHECDALVDQNFYLDLETRYLNRLPTHTKTFLGPKYALLRPEFNRLRGQLNFSTNIARMLIFFGGIDAPNATLKILQGLAHERFRDLFADVVLGEKNPHQTIIKDYCAAFPHYQVHCPAHNIAELMLKADLCLGAGGSSTWERCALGLPSILVTIAKNQEQLIHDGVSAQIFESFGHVNDLNTQNIAEKLTAVLDNPKQYQQMRENSLKLVDGLGVQRVINALEEIIHD